ncbi:MAG: calcium-binding protein [Nostoc sp.]|uniref:calcium-binding protein n=1 Tax=Nostoc sp. TaxID=1180 RepID=UPI002FFBEB3E
MPTINGTNGADNLSVPFSNSFDPNLINGFDGNDTIQGGFGGDTINGGDGDDSLVGGGHGLINGGNGNDTIRGGFGDTINGDDGNDSLVGSGDGLINGGDGNDTIQSGGGTEILTGGSGNDIFKFNSVFDSPAGFSRDVITDFVGVGNSISPGAGDQIDLSSIAFNQALTFIGASAFSAPDQVRYSGGILQVSIFGNQSPEFEIQLAGSPQIVASDIILSGTFNDSSGTFNDSNDGTSISSTTTSDGGSGMGNSSVSSGFDGDIVDVGANDNYNYTIKGGTGNDTINAGGTGNDTIDGGSGNDTINGGRGNDILTGGTGTDILTGGPGNDIFKFNSVSDSPAGVSRDVITDFVGNGNLPGDQIDLSAIDANSTIAGNQAFTFIGASAFSAPGQIRYVGDILSGNTAGNQSPDFEIQLTGSPQLVASDIIL